MLSNRRYWATPAAMVAALTTQLATAQALPVAEINPMDTASALLAPAASASAPTFSQLSAPVSKHSHATDEQAQGGTNGEGLWLPLAGAAALAFVARRNRRAFHTSPHPQAESA